MRELAIYGVLFPLLDAYLAAQYPTLTITCYRSYNPTQQGAPDDGIVVLHRLGSKRYGSPRRASHWDGDSEVFTETQLYETTFQVDGLMIENPVTATASTVTTVDIVQSVAEYLQSYDGLAALRAAGLSILRITDIRLTYITDDRNRDEAAPSFDFVLLHESVTIAETPYIQTFEAGLYPV